MSKRTCPECGNEQNADLLICKKCRTDLEAIEIATPSAMPQIHGTVERPFWGTVGAIMAGIQCVGSILLMYYFLAYIGSNGPLLLAVCIISILSAVLSGAIAKNLWTGSRKYNGFYLVTMGIFLLLSIVQVSPLSIVVMAVLFFALLQTTNHPYYNRS